MLFGVKIKNVVIDIHCQGLGVFKPSQSHYENFSYIENH